MNVYQVTSATIYVKVIAERGGGAEVLFQNPHPDFAEHARSFLALLCFSFVQLLIFTQGSCLVQRQSVSRVALD